MATTTSFGISGGHQWGACPIDNFGPTVQMPQYGPVRDEQHLAPLDKKMVLAVSDSAVQASLIENASHSSVGGNMMPALSLSSVMYAARRLAAIVSIPSEITLAPASSVPKPILHNFAAGQDWQDEPRDHLQRRHHMDKHLKQIRGARCKGLLFTNISGAACSLRRLSAYLNSRSSHPQSCQQTESAAPMTKWLVLRNKVDTHPGNRYILLPWLE